MLQIVFGAVMLGLLWALLSLGVYLTYRILNIADLTVEGSIALGAALAARAIFAGHNPFLATILAFWGGVLAGLATGLLHTRLKIPALLSGILTMIALYSVNLRILGKANLSLLRLDTVYVGFAKFGAEVSQALPAMVFALPCLGFVLAILHWFFDTELGYALRASGDNPQMARAQGISTSTMTVLGLMISNGLAALGGALICQQQAYADIQMGTGAIVIGLASVIIGEILYARRGLFSHLIAVVLGSISYRLIIALVLELGMPAHDLKLFTAITVAIALALPVFRSYLAPLKKGVQEVA